ncbi:hypothetical protein Tco_0814809 [Tanacetum coccineum]
MRLIPCQFRVCFNCKIGDEGGRGVKEKNGVAPSAEEKNEAVKDGVTPSVTVASRNSTGTQKANSVKAGHDNLTMNTWGKYRLVRSMLNSSTGIFSFQFSSMDGLDAMLENSPWFIRKNPLIRKKWNPNVNLLKEDVGNVSVWVKLHGVYVTAFSEDGLNAISTKLGTPLMLESYTSDMCMQS